MVWMFDLILHTRNDMLDEYTDGNDILDEYTDGNWCARWIYIYGNWCAK